MDSSEVVEGAKLGRNRLRSCLTICLARQRAGEVAVPWAQVLIQYTQPDMPNQGSWTAIGPPESCAKLRSCNRIHSESSSSETGCNAFVADLSDMGRLLS